MRAAIVRKSGYLTFILFPLEHKLVTVARSKPTEKFVNGTMHEVWTEIVKNSRRATKREVAHARKWCKDEIFDISRYLQRPKVTIKPAH